MSVCLAYQISFTFFSPSFLLLEFTNKNTFMNDMMIIKNEVILPKKFQRRKCDERSTRKKRRDIWRKQDCFNTLTSKMSRETRKRRVAAWVKHIENLRGRLRWLCRFFLRKSSMKEDGRIHKYFANVNFSIFREKLLHILFSCNCVWVWISFSWNVKLEQRERVRERWTEETHYHVIFIL